MATSSSRKALRSCRSSLGCASRKSHRQNAHPGRQAWRRHLRRRLVRVAAHHGVPEKSRTPRSPGCRPRRGSHAREPREVRPRRCPRRGSRPATRICSRRPTSTSSRSRRPITCTPTRRSRAAAAGKHIVLEKPTGLDVGELVRIRDAVRRAGVRTIVSFELRYNPYLKFARWLRTSGWLGEIRFARTQYLSHVTDWYSGWEWVRTRESGRSHLLAAGCHAVDALRWCSGLEPVEVSAFHTHFTEGYEWPTSIVVNMGLEGSALGHVTSSTDFMMPYPFPGGADGRSRDAAPGPAAVARRPLDLDDADAPRTRSRTCGSKPATDVLRPAGDSHRLRDARLGRRQPPPVSGRDRRAGRVHPRRARRRRSTCSTRRRRWRSVWRPIDPRSSAASRSRLPLIAD